MAEDELAGIYEDELTECVKYCDGRISARSVTQLMMSTLRFFTRIHGRSADSPFPDSPGHTLRQGAEESTHCMRGAALPLDKNPALASHLARFDKRYVALVDHASKALHEARCEVEIRRTPSAGMIALAGNRCVWTGGCGWKQREPLLMTWPDIKRRGLQKNDEIKPDFYEPAWNVVTDLARDLIWVQGDARIKVFDWDGALEYTLYALDASGLLQLGDKVYAGSSEQAGTLSWWDITRVPQQDGALYAGELEDEADEEDEEESEVLPHWVVSTTGNGLACWQDVEVTRGHMAHGQLELCAALGTV
ncbi:hypothetical protein WJX72_009047 [[Myrmecia] bisecta]|uniref:Uncharacterized protein n=1 Tax=[Myrmecia] bisecta TaxID=41462 RepID=A0AAW1Q8D4_9CHLO